METREWSKEELKKLGFSFEDSKSNFIFATHKKRTGREDFSGTPGTPYLCAVF